MPSLAMQMPLGNFSPRNTVRVVPVVGVVADDPAVAARLQAIDRPFVHFVANGGLREEDAAVVGDVEVVGEPQAAVVVDRIEAAVGLVCDLLDLAVGRDAIEPHAADADIEIVVAIEGHAERLAADMGEDLHLLVVGRQEADDVAVARARIEIVVAIEDDVFRRLDAAEADQRSRRAACRSARMAPLPRISVEAAGASAVDRSG